MQSTLERGEARCPRCGRSANYSFAHGEAGALWYEVQCEGCGHAHSEQTGIWDTAAA